MVKPVTLAKKIAKVCDAKKGENIVILNVSKISNFCDYFVIVTGVVENHISSLVDETVVEIKKVFKIVPFRIEGKEFKRWVILDYGRVIVHIMNPELREFYALEKIWAKGKMVSYETKTKKRAK
jgi:ribosome-associated protein